jgi:hypothetical protein
MMVIWRAASASLTENTGGLAPPPMLSVLIMVLGKSSVLPSVSTYLTTMLLGRPVGVS